MNVALISGVILVAVLVLWLVLQSSQEHQKSKAIESQMHDEYQMSFGDIEGFLVRSTFDAAINYFRKLRGLPALSKQNGQVLEVGGENVTAQDTTGNPQAP